MVKKNILTILVALIIMYLSLTNSETFKKVSFPELPNLDKIVHFGMYFVLMSAIIFENRKTIKSKKHLFLIALIPLFYGIFMEIIQSILIISRTGNFYDIISNSAGIFFSLLLWLWIKPLIKETIR